VGTIQFETVSVVEARLLWVEIYSVFSSLRYGIGIIVRIRRLWGQSLLNHAWYSAGGYGYGLDTEIGGVVQIGMALQSSFLFPNAYQNWPTADRYWVCSKHSDRA
jgi:hypothetical protein